MSALATSIDEDAGLVSLISAGDEEAFLRFYEKFSRPLYSMLMKILGNAQDAEEVLQLAFLQVWKRAATFQPGRASVFTWLVIITRSKAVDRIRQRQRQNRLVEEAAQEAPVQTSSFIPDSAQVIQHEQREAIRRALEQIPGDQREAIEMAFFQGLTQNEISTALGAPLGTVKARIRRGMLRLRDCLKGRL
jgi:RNA polymerase sigma-70 factor (ECF subfamily)